MADYLDELARFAAETRFEDIPAEALDAARWIVLDTLGGMLVSSTLPETRKFAELVAARSARPCCTLVGFPEQADPTFAAMVNAASACSYETDEGNRWGGGHPAIHTLPPALAAAQAQHASGRDFLAAFIVAYEVMSRLASGSPARWPVHSHGTHGSPGAAVAVARLRGHDQAAMRRVINLATCMSPATTWQVCFEGGTVRNLFPAESCLLGMLAVDLDGCGYTSMASAPAEMFGRVLGTDSYAPDRVLDGLGERWRVTTNYFKLHASCAITHPALDAMVSLLDRRPLAAEDIARIDVHAGGHAVDLGYDDPSNMLSAKFSIPYSLAAAVVLRDTSISAFRGDALTNPAVRALAGRVAVHDDPTASPPPAPRAARVAVTLADGTQLTAETLLVRGDAANPVDRGVLLDKFRALAGERCSPEAVQSIREAVMVIDAVEDVSALHHVLSAG